MQLVALEGREELHTPVLHVEVQANLNRSSDLLVDLYRPSPNGGSGRQLPRGDAGRAKRALLALLALLVCSSVGKSFHSERKRSLKEVDGADRW